MEIAINMRAATRTEAAAVGDWLQTPHEDRAPGRTRQQHFNVKKTTTQKKKKYKKKDASSSEAAVQPSLPEAAAQPSLLNLAGHFVELTRRCEDERTNGKRFNKFMQNAKKKLICDLKSTYIELYDCYNDPSKRLPNWLSSLPPAKYFLTEAMDGRLLSKTLQIQQGVRAFVEELHFICLDVGTLSCLGGESVILKLRLDVETVPTPGSLKCVKNMLHTFEGVLE